MWSWIECDELLDDNVQDKGLDDVEWIPTIDDVDEVTVSGQPSKWDDARDTDCNPRRRGPCDSG